MKLIRIGICEFALPVPRLGSIEALSGYGKSAKEGQLLHIQVQEQRKKADAAYEAEVVTAHVFEHEGYHFQVSGRIDGLFTSNPPRIEEIKSSFNIYELEKKLTREKDHPY